MVMDELFSQALLKHQAGDLIQAQVLYNEVLNLDPRHADSLHLVGLVHHQLGDHVEALRLIDLAILQRDSIPVFHGNRGTVLRALGMFEQALSALER